MMLCLQLNTVHPALSFLTTARGSWIPATISVLPEIVDAVAGKVEVYVDGGIRRGTDVLKAIACGARAVFIGRPVLWGLASGAEAGVRYVLEMLRQEFDLAMALSGCPTLGSITRDLIRGL